MLGPNWRYKVQQYLINVYLNIRAGERNKMKQDDVSGKRRNSLDGTNFAGLGTIISSIYSIVYILIYTKLKNI